MSHLGTPFSINVKVVFLGDSSVGKTCLIKRIISNTFEIDQPSTIGASFSSYTVTTPKTEINFMFWDTAGEERFHSVAPSFIRGAEIGVAVFDLSDRASFDSVSFWKKELREHAQMNARFVVVGNKADKITNLESTTAEIASLCKNMDADFYPTSALSGDGIKDLVDAFVNYSTVHSGFDETQSFRLPAQNEQPFCQC